MFSNRVMVDWLTFFVFLPHQQPLFNGQVISIDKSGEIEFITDKSIHVEGSYSSSLTVKSYPNRYDSYLSADYRYDSLYFSGNPVKFFQGHNVFGSNDLYGLCRDIILFTLKHLGREDLYLNHVSGEDLGKLLYPTIRFTRIDLTGSFNLSSESNCSSFIDASSIYATLPYRGKGTYAKDTLYWGQSSTHWTLKVYAKGPEVRSNKKHYRDVPDDVYTHSCMLVRFEVCLRSRKLKDMGLSQLHQWKGVDPYDVFSIFFKKFSIPEEVTMSKTDDVINILPPHLLGVYYTWLNGSDCKALYPKTTFHRYRTKLRELIGIDISTINREGNDLKMPLFRVFEMKPATIPDNLKQYLYEPKKEELPDFSIYKNEKGEIEIDQIGASIF